VRRVCFSCFALSLWAAAPPARFTEHTIASGLKGGYQVVVADLMAAAACAVADLNADGRPDIACIDSTRLKWYENR
jgi:hypothetical protein